MHQNGTVADFRALITAIEAIAEARHMSFATITSGGVNYVVGDLVSPATGSTSRPALVEVVAIGGGGAATEIRIRNNGAYVADPTNGTTTGGSGSGLILGITMRDTGWSVLRRPRMLASTEATGLQGTGYQVGDILTLTGGVVGSLGRAATVQVDSLGTGGGVMETSVVDAGYYEVQPVPAFTNSWRTSGGSGTGAHVRAIWTNRNNEDGTWVFQGPPLGTDPTLMAGTPPPVPPGAPIPPLPTLPGRALGAIRTYVQGPVSGFALAGMIHHDDGEDVATLSNDWSPAFRGDTIDTSGSFVPLTDGTGGTNPIQFWLSISERRIFCVAKCSDATTTRYLSFHLGLLDPYGTNNQQPYPFYVFGSCPRPDTEWDAPKTGITARSITGPTVCYGVVSRNGPGWIFNRTQNIWQDVKNGLVDEIRADVAEQQDRVVIPFGRPDLPLVESNVTASTLFSISQMRSIDSLTSPPIRPIIGTLEIGELSPHRPMFPVSIAIGGSSPELRGEMRSIFWAPFDNSANPEDHIIADGVRINLFPNGSTDNRTHHFFGMEER